MTVAALIVAFRSGSELQEAVARYRAHGVTVAVIDNGPHELRPAGADVYLFGHGNIGYGAGLNLGFQAVRAQLGTPDWILLANDDAIPSDALLREVVTGSLVNYDIVGFRSASGSEAWRRPLPSARAIAAAAMGREEWWMDRRPVEHSYPVGALLAVRGSVYEQLHGFNPRYFLYFEEVDFIERAVRMGHRFGFAAASLDYVHESHGATSQFGPERWRELGRSGALYYTDGRKLAKSPWLLAQVGRLAGQWLISSIRRYPDLACEARMTLIGLLAGLIVPRRAERRCIQAFGRVGASTHVRYVHPRQERGTDVMGRRSNGSPRSPRAPGSSSGDRTTARRVDDVLP